MKFLSEKLADHEIEAFGKKAGNLALLHQSGAKVPDGFVIRWDSSFTDEQLSNSIEKIGGFPVAVRSSGQLEDLEGTSFAGQYETYLYLESVEDVKKAIKNCFESTKSERIKEYLRNNNIQKNDDELLKSFSILIQKMIDPYFAGVSFSVNPITGIEEHILIEACLGVGESLVSGEVTPNQYVYDIKKKEIVSKREEVEIDISEKFFAEMAENILDIEAYFNTPQDIEWAVDKEGVLWILQARPITFITWRSDLGELTNADLKDGGISSAVCTTLMYSLYRNAMNVSMPAYFKKLRLLRKDSPRNWLYHCYGRGFWDAGAVKKMLESIPGYDEQKFDTDLGIMKDYGNNGPVKTPLSPKSLLKAIPVVIGMESEFKNCFNEAKAYYESFSNIEKPWHDSLLGLPKLSDEKLYEEFIRLYNEIFLKTEPFYYRVIYNNSNLQTVFKEFLEKIEAKTGEKILYINLFSELEDVSHLKIQKDLKKVYEHLDDRAHLYEYVDEFLQEHFHHGDRELDITVPRWGEVPQRVVEMAKNYTEGKVSAKSPYQEERQRVEKIITSMGFFGKSNLKKFRKKLKFVREYLVLREKMRELSTRSYYLLRIYVLEIAKRLKSNNIINEEQDIFHYEADDILALLTRQTPLCEEELNYRRTRYAGMRDIDAPNDFGFGRVEAEQEMSFEDGKTRIKGIACSPGVIRGRAFVALSLEDVKELQTGDLLITKFTDPGWTPTLGKVSGVVTEVGGVLSHAAVISREYGIPAILNVKNATKIVKTGSIIEINGDMGIITIES